MLARLVLFIATLFSASCASGSKEACFSSSSPGANQAPDLRHYPVARQGSITAWLTSDHRRKGGGWLLAPDGSGTRHRIVGEIRAAAMPVGCAHGGAFLLTDTYHGPVFPALGRPAGGRQALYREGERLGPRDALSGVGEVREHLAEAAGVHQGRRLERLPAGDW
jgi:hypothetical protein